MSLISKILALHIFGLGGSPMTSKGFILKQYILSNFLVIIGRKVGPLQACQP